MNEDVIGRHLGRDVRKDGDTHPACFECRKATDLPLFSLDLRLQGGNRTQINYSYLESAELDLSGSIKLFASTHSITFSGRCLTPLYEAIGRHDVVWIKELGEFAENTTQVPFVEHIRIERKKG